MDTYLKKLVKDVNRVKQSLTGRWSPSSISGYISGCIASVLSPHIAFGTKVEMENRSFSPIYLLTFPCGYTFSIAFHNIDTDDNWEKNITVLWTKDEHGIDVEGVPYTVSIYELGDTLQRLGQLHN